MTPNLNATVERPREGSEEELCIQCMSGNQPGTHFCRNCGAPLSSYAATAPFESVFAEGHVYRRATEQPHRLIVVLGMWLIFSVAAWAGILMAVAGWGTPGHVGVLAGVALTAVSLALIARTTWNYRKRRVMVSRESP